MNGQDMNSQDILKMLQQKIGNVELTIHSILQVLEDKDLLTQDEVNQQAQQIVEEMQEVELEHEEVDT
jgi:hypothetical protein